MKAIYTGLLFFLAAVVLSGCVKDNTDDCPGPDRNLVIHFEYFDGEGDDIFADRIEMVDVVIFDGDYNFYNWIYLSKQSLDEFRGVRTEVDPGDYHILCWANITSSRTDIEGESSIGSAIYHYDPETADPLHYAPDMRRAAAGRVMTRSLTADGTWLVKVGEDSVTEDTVAFMSAHRTLNVYMKNFPGMDDDVPVYPVSRVNNLVDYYNLNLSRTAPENKYFVQTSDEVDIDGEPYCHARFYIPHFDNDNNVKLQIDVPQPYDITTDVTMDEILEINNIDSVYDGDDLVLDVEIIWGDTFVTIKLPEFRVIDVEPEY